MCGICGIVSQKALTPIEIDLVGALNQSLSHRGPDGAGAGHHRHAAMAMRRLSIIDLDGGWQPFYNEDRSVALVANGEIYNFVELRRTLESRGHRFATGSDCETILHLYEDFGLDCVHHLRGMFAFALWDEQRRRLVLGRDRMGEKPLYIYEQNRQLLFASELKALVRTGAVPFELDPQAIDLYFHYQYVPEPGTPLRGVRKLDAARLLVVDIDPWRVTEKCYWRMEDAPPIEARDPALTVREKLEETIALVLRADVPVGVALSGGLDSGAVAALANRKYAGNLCAFSVGYTGRPDSDERADARETAAHLGLPFYEVAVDITEMVEFFPELTYWRDDPIADISGHGYYAVMKLARAHGVPVMLQGQGGDELFWGYELLREAAHQSRQKHAYRRRGMVGALPQYLALCLPDEVSRGGLSRWARSLGGLRPGWRRLQSHRRAPAERMVFYDLSNDFMTAARETESFYNRAFADQLRAGGAAELFTFPHPWPRIDIALTRLVCDTYLRENGITQGDRLSMASSVEMRLPLVDYQLIETIIGLRKTQTDDARPAKALLKAALRDLLPPRAMSRPKRGFTPPTREWHEALFAAYGDSLRGGYLVQKGVLSEEGGRRLAAGEFPEGAVAPLSFKALVLEQWCRRMLRQPSVN